MEKNLLICACTDLSGGHEFVSGGDYLVRVELPTGRAYSAELREGDNIEFATPPDFTIATGIVVLPDINGVRL